MIDRSSGPVVVVGAGLAGLACAQRLARAGVDVVVIEASDGVGGRVRTDLVGGYRCDRGFQVVNPSYPALRRVVDLAELDLRPFEAGVMVASGEDRYVLADPRREPRRLAETLRAPVGSLADKLRVVRWAAPSLLPVERLLNRVDRTRAADLDAAGLHGPLRSVVDLYLAGVLAEDQGSTSANLVALLVRSFVLGTPAVPALGASRLPELLAASLPPETVRLNTPVVAVSGEVVRTAEGEMRARAVVVATDPRTAGELTGLPAPSMKSLTTFWHTADEPPSRQRLLHVDADLRGPVLNSVVVTAAAPSYAPAGRSLVATTVLGIATGTDAEQEARRHAGLLYGVNPASWQLVKTSVVDGALPAQPPPLQPRRPVDLGGGLFVAGDHRDTASIQGALVSGRRAADAVLSRS